MRGLFFLTNSSQLYDPDLVSRRIFFERSFLLSQYKFSKNKGFFLFLRESHKFMFFPIIPLP